MAKDGPDDEIDTLRERVDELEERADSQAQRMIDVRQAVSDIRAAIGDLRGALVRDRPDGSVEAKAGRLDIKTWVAIVGSIAIPIVIAIIATGSH